MFEGKLAVLQRVVPAYRVPFFETLASRCLGGLTLLAGQPLPLERIRPAETLAGVRFHETVNRHFFHPRHPLYACRQKGVLDWLESEAPDVLIVEANPRYLSTRAAIEAMHRRNKPVLGWGLGAPPLSGSFSGLREQARKRLASSLDGLIAYSKRGAGEYLQLGVLDEERIFVAHNAVAPPPDTPAPHRGALRRPLAVLFVGRLQPRKRLDLLFAACARLPDDLRPNLTIVGDGPARKDFESAAAAAYPRAVFAGELFGEALAAQFLRADLFVLPGTGGLAVQEAMSHALPVLVAQGDGTQDDLVRPQNGWLVPPDDPEALADALHQALTDPGLRAKGQESRRIVEEEINISRMADHFILAVNRVSEGR